MRDYHIAMAAKSLRGFDCARMMVGYMMAMGSLHDGLWLWN